MELEEHEIESIVYSNIINAYRQYLIRISNLLNKITELIKEVEKFKE